MCCICRTACINLEEYHTAKIALEKGASFAPDDSRFTNLIQQCQRFIAAGMNYNFFLYEIRLMIFVNFIGNCMLMCCYLLG